LDARGGLGVPIVTTMDPKVRPSTKTQNPRRLYFQGFVALVDQARRYVEPEIEVKPPPERGMDEAESRVMTASYAITSLFRCDNCTDRKVKKRRTTIRLPVWESNRRPKRVWVRLEAA